MLSWHLLMRLLNNAIDDKVTMLHQRWQWLPLRDRLIHSPFMFGRSSAECYHGLDVMCFFGNAQHLVGLVVLEAGHEVCDNAAAIGLEGELHASHASVETVGRFLQFLVFVCVKLVRHDQHQCSGIDTPLLVKWPQKVKQSLPLFVGTIGVNKSPWLQIAEWWRPLGRLPQTVQLTLRYGLPVQLVGRGSAHEYRVYRVLSLSSLCERR